MDDLYREIIIDHYKNPRHKGKLSDSKFIFEDENPLCGDHIEIFIETDQNEIITEAKFDGQGCAISMASADLLIDSMIGKDINSIKAMTKETILELLGIELSPVRLKCALLSLKVAKAAAFGLKEASDEINS